jgi:two-component system, chemotaxis family, CheB/CheR fusion protein
MASRDNYDNSGPSQDAQPVVPIVGLGASAGGIAALQTFLTALPEQAGAAFVVIVHLDPEHQSDLAGILATRTTMSVVQVEKSEPLEPDHVYVIPPNRRLVVTDHELKTAPFDEPRGHRAPIDLFFRSLADHGDGYAVILSGAGTDGAVGVRAVKGAGGIVMVQDPNEAEYPSMPRAAIATGIADFVLPVGDIAPRLVDLLRSRANLSVAVANENDEDLLRRVLAHLRVRTGHDFSKYKRSTVLRQIARRMQVTRTDGLAEYYAFLRSNSDEAQALLGDLLITVTSFFRDRHAFETLRTRVLPELFADREMAETVRVWIAGCATGEEAYSITMLLLEEAARHEIRPPIQIFASDLDARALMTACEGRYPAAIEADVSEERLRRFFSAEKEGYRVRQDVRDLILFANHDLLKDPPFSRVDLISCRNLMIYLDRDLQEQVCNTFHYALNPGGYLMLGTSETADQPSGLFRPIDRNARIYQSTALAGEKPRLLPRLLGGIGTRDFSNRFEHIRQPTEALMDVAAHRQALERLAPPSVMVDDLHHAIHLSETAGRYMQPSGGQVSTDIGEMVRPELRFELRSALHRAFEQGEPTLTLPIPVRFNGTARRVNMLVRPVQADGDAETRRALVMFIEGDAVESAGGTEGQQQATDETVRRLTEELETMQARLRTVREESEAGNEELRAANEELQSINEEYRSTSEELETSKEELQSVNEELQTVNNELKLKLDAASRANSDLENLMAATDIATLFLDTSLRIKLFTERLTDLFSVTPADAGRPITDFSHQLEYDDFVKDMRAVLNDLTPIHREVRSQDGSWFDVRMRPYRTAGKKIDGVVIIFVDVTERLRNEQMLRDSEEELRQLKTLIDKSYDSIIVWDFDGRILNWNNGSERLYGYSAAEAVGKLAPELLRTEVPGSSFKALQAELLRGSRWTGNLQQTTKDGRTIRVESRMQLNSTEDKRLVLEIAYEEDEAGTGKAKAKKT